MPHDVSLYPSSQTLVLSREKTMNDQTPTAVAEGSTLSSLTELVDDLHGSQKELEVLTENLTIGLFGKLKSESAGEAVIPPKFKESLDISTRLEFLNHRQENLASRIEAIIEGIGIK
jgi:hypothetical protein